MNIKKLARELAEKATPREFTETKTLPTPNKKEPKGQSHGRQSTAERERGLNEQTSIGQHYTEPYSMSAGRTTVPNEMDHPTDTSRGIPTAAHSKYGEGRSEMRPYQGMIKPNAPLQDPRTRKSDFDDLVRAINVNIMNSYSKFRNKDGLDEFIQGEKKRTGATGKNKPQTKLEKPDLPSRTTGLGDASLSYQLGKKPTKKNPDPKLRGTRDSRIFAGRQFDAEGKKLPPKESPKVEPLKNPHRVDEKGKYIRGTGYEKPVTGYKKIKPRQGTDRSREALPSTRTADRHEGKLQGQIAGDWKGVKGVPNEKPSQHGIHGKDRILGIETQEPLAPHAHLREQDKKTGEVISNRYSTDPRNVKWRKGGHKPNTAQERAEEDKKIRQGMINLKANLDAVMKKIQQSTFGTTFDDRGGHVGDTVPTRETFGDERFRGNPVGVKHKKPENEKQLAENTAGKELADAQWNKDDFSMNYSSPDERTEREAKEWQKKKMALLKAFLSPISFKYTHKGWGNTYERGQTKQVESQDHSRTGNTNNNQLYEGDKDDDTIKSLDEVYKEFKKKQ